MKKVLLAAVLGTLVVLGASAAQKGTKSTKLTCTLTKKTIETCCCIQKDGKLYCTLAKKVVDPCCCKPSDK